MSQEYLLVPTIYEQLLEIVMLIMCEINSKDPKKLGKRTVRVSFGIEIPGVLTELQKREIRRRLTILPEETNETSLFYHQSQKVIQGTFNLVHYLSSKFACPNDLPIYPSFYTEKKMIDKRDCDAFLTREMHLTPALFIIGCWINNLVIKDVISNHQDQYNRGEFKFLGKGGCFYGFTLLCRNNISPETAEDIYEYCNLGDVDIGIYICNDIDNKDQLRHSICENITRISREIKLAFFKRGTIFSNLVEELVPQSIKDAGYQIANRGDIKLEKADGLKGILYNTLKPQKNDDDDYDGYMWFSDNDTLTFGKSNETVSFRLQRFCIGFKKNKELYKSEVVDWATSGFNDSDVINGKFYELLEKTIPCTDFTSPEYIDHLAKLLPRRFPFELANKLKFLMTFEL